MAHRQNPCFWGIVRPAQVLLSHSKTDRLKQQDSIFAMLHKRDSLFGEKHVIGFYAKMGGPKYLSTERIASSSL